MNTSSGLSVLIPTYQGEAFVGDAMASALGQAQLPCEVIIVDDLSTDRTVEVCESRAHGAAVPVRVIRLDANSGGPARPINVGVEAARGELILVLDQDDVLAPGRIEADLELLSRPDAAAAFWLSTRMGDETGEFCQSEEMRAAVDTVASGGFIHSPDMLRLLMVLGNFVIGFPGFTFRRTAWERAGGVDERLRICGDYDFLCRLAEQGGFGYRNRVGYRRRVHSENLSSRADVRFGEVAAIRSAVFLRQPKLRDDPGLSRRLRDWYDQSAYWLDRAGERRAALRTLRIMAAIWGWDRVTLRRLVRLIAMWPVPRGKGKRPAAGLAFSSRLPA